MRTTSSMQPVPLLIHEVGVVRPNLTMHGDPPCIVIGGLVVLEVLCPDTIQA